MRRRRSPDHRDAAGDRLDGFARELAEPVTRRRALKIAAAALIGLAIPLRAPGRARADDFPCSSWSPCQPGLALCCVEFERNGRQSRGWGCIDPATTQCCRGLTPYVTGEPDYPSVYLCPKDSICGPADSSESNCFAACAHSDLDNGGRPGTSPYDPETQCCGKFGPEPRDRGWSFPGCEATRVRRPGFRPSSNGCGTAKFRAPRSFTRHGFTPACNAHDRCYDTCNTTQEQCDAAFRKALDRICDRRYAKGSARHEACTEDAGWAGIFLSLGGEAAYRAAQKNACVCCPGPLPGGGYAPPRPPPPKRKRKPPARRRDD